MLCQIINESLWGSIYNYKMPNSILSCHKLATSLALSFTSNVFGLSFFFNENRNYCNRASSSRTHIDRHMYLCAVDFIDTRKFNCYASVFSFCDDNKKMKSISSIKQVVNFHNLNIEQTWWRWHTNLWVFCLILNQQTLHISKLKTNKST